MSDEWNFYFCRVNDKSASIALDLGLRKQVPDRSKPNLLWVWVYFKSPRPDGLSDSSEFDLLTAIEEKLTETMGRNFNAILSGRITTDGHREFFYYGSHSDEFESAVADAMGNFPGYEFDCGTQGDPGWKQYLEVLYPSDEDRQRIENRSVLDVLEQKGDTLKAPRDIFHWIYFRTKNDRDAFWTAIQQLEYRMESQPEKPGGAFPFGLCIVRFQSLKQDDVDEAVIELFRRAKEFHGDYDGWETKAIPQ
jgi:Family of unknown function (DUF695)/Regulator of ribonuclease activity B